MNKSVRFDILTIFPKPLLESIRIGLLEKAIKSGLVSVGVHDIRDHSDDKNRKVDDSPYGGGPGMIMSPGPIVRGIEAIEKRDGRIKKVLLSPRGGLFSQKKAADYATLDQIILVCGRYEGVDERVSAFVDEELSIGDYVLGGGEFAALVVLDAVSRLVPGVVGDPESLNDESHTKDGLEYPQYTKPREFRGMAVPEVLLGGNHKEIEKWRREEATKLTKTRRPDLAKG